MKYTRKHQVIIFFLFLNSLLNGQNTVIKEVKLTDFRLQSSVLIPQTGEQLTSGAYSFPVWWFPVKVPSTVLSGLVANKIYPDPYHGMNNMYIPDASDEFNKKYDLEKYSHLPGQPNPWKNPYWYVTDFTVPVTDKGKHFELVFKGINYRAAVWLNGKQVADSTRMAGMFAQYNLDISGLVRAGAANHLAVKIYPLDYAGLPAKEQLRAFDDFYENGGPTGDIGKNVTMLCSVGWDWMPPVRDRNMGIWQPVLLRTSGFVTIERPQIITELPSLPDTSVAKLSIGFDLKNNGTVTENGRIVVSVGHPSLKKPITFTKNIASEKGKIVRVNFSAENTKELSISQPKLWWPNGYGKPELYTVKIQYFTSSGLSDEKNLRIGIRTVATKAVDVNGTWRRDFYVNGRKIQLTGGAWVPDMLLNRDSARYDYEFRLCRNANINLVRIWGGGVTPSDYFFDAADTYGLLVWSDFWVTGDTQGEFKGSPDWPLDGEIFRKNVESTIYRIRNHPSLLVWTGGNEGHARKELYYAMRDSIIKLDGTRPFIPSSSGFAKLPEGWDGSWPDGKPSGVYSGGPYTWQDPKEYFRRADAGRDWVFKDETGIPSQPVYSTLPLIIPNLVWDKTLPFPLNDSWGYHDACTGNGKYDNYFKEMVKRFGEPSSMKDFSDCMQVMNAIGYQGIFESAGHKLNDIGGIMLWKLNAAFPSVVWQVYDWFLVPNAGYYFMQNACEPVHIQLNTKDLNVEYINRTYKPVKSLSAEITVYNSDSKSLFIGMDKVDLGEYEAKGGISIAAVINKNPSISFVVLNLKNTEGKTVSHNVYWISPGENFLKLKNLPSAAIIAKAENGVSAGNEKRWELQVTNNSDKIAFFVNPRLMTGENEIAPSFWSSNYFTLAPGESADISVGCPREMSEGEAMSIRIEGWNINQVTIPLK